jgi:hypothetical protein
MAATRNTAEGMVGIDKDRSGNRQHTTRVRKTFLLANGKQGKIEQTSDEQEMRAPSRMGRIQKEEI